MDKLNKLLRDYEESEDIFAGRDVEPEAINHVPADDTVSVYFRQMASEPLLTADEEVALAKRIERGREAQEILEDNDDLTDEQVRQLENIVYDGQAAREHLARANTRLVISFAKRYRNQGLPMSDLIQEGNVGLMRAVDKYDHTMGNRFSTYASWWIRQAITRALAKKSRTIRLPLHMSDKLRRIKRTISEISQEIGRKPTFEELAEQLDMTPAEIEDVLDVNPHTISLEMPVGDGDSEYGDFIEDRETPTPDEELSGVMMKETIERGLEELSQREADILRLRFGLDDGTPQTLQQVGKVVGLSRERVRQIEKKALRRLRHGAIGSSLRDFAA